MESSFFPANIANMDQWEDLSHGRWTGYILIINNAVKHPASHSDVLNKI